MEGDGVGNGDRDTGVTGNLVHLVGTGDELELISGLEVNDVGVVVLVFMGQIDAQCRILRPTQVLVGQGLI